ncbi:MAG: hypothetical protein ABH875_05350 [Candidatus Omnitrophota bacterium]
MKRICLTVLLVSIFLIQPVFALETTLRDIRSEIYAESVEVKALMGDTRDPILISSIYDSCLITITQLDAYFHMLTIFNTIERKAMKDEAVDGLASWLGAVKEMNDLNIKSLSNTSQALSDKTNAYMEKLTKFYGKLNDKIDAELKKIDTIKKSLKLR